MRTAEAAGRANELSAAVVLDVLAGSSPRRPIEVGPGDLQAVEATVEGQRLLLVCFDYSRNQGSIGIQEADQLVAAMRHAGSADLGLVLLLETSGIRVTDGTAGIASLRRLLREAEDARLDGVRMLALILKSAFGGASMLAALCERRIVHAGSLFSMSGPKLIEQTVGPGRFRAGDRHGVRDVLGGAARAAVSHDFILVEADAEAYRAALASWLHERPTPLTLEMLSATGRQLAGRLPVPLPEPTSVGADTAMLEPEAGRIMRSVLPEGFELQRAEGVLVARPNDASKTRVLALMTPSGASARDALVLARELIAPSRRGERWDRCVLLVDAESHLATPEDERTVLSEALAHLALVIRTLHRSGQRVDVVVTRRGGGGIQGALGSGATSVAIGPLARLFVLPHAAMQALNKSEDADAGSIATALRVGAIDHPYSAHSPTLERSNHVV